MGAASRAKWNSRAKRYIELLNNKGPGAAEEFKNSFDKPWKLDEAKRKVKL